MLCSIHSATGSSLGLNKVTFWIKKPEGAVLPGKVSLLEDILGLMIYCKLSCLCKQKTFSFLSIACFIYQIFALFLFYSILTQHVYVRSTMKSSFYIAIFGVLFVCVIFLTLHFLSRAKPSKKGQFTLKRKKSKAEVDFEDMICPLQPT